MEIQANICVCLNANVGFQLSRSLRIFFSLGLFQMIF